MTSTKEIIEGLEKDFAIISKNNMKKTRKNCKWWRGNSILRKSMRNKIVLAILIILAVLFGWLAFRNTEAKEYISLEECFYYQPNMVYVPLYVLGVEIDECLYVLIECESGGDPNAWNKDDPNGGSKGILQFQEPTFQKFCVEKYRLENDIWSPEIQIKCAEKMLDEGLINHWSCGKEMLDSSL